jgi:hypothetical protein
MGGPTLVYCGTRLREQGERICLTDCWRAAGSDPNKRPAEWLRQEGPQEFIRYIADSLNMGIDHIAIADRGGTSPATWAHWQIGMAYAKYLSPEFHAWCNEVVRAHMEGRHYGSLTAQLETKLVEAARRGAKEGAQEAAKQVNDNVIDFRKEFREHRRETENKRRDFGPDTIRQVCLTVLLQYGGKDPIDRETRIVDDDGRPISGACEIDHWEGRHNNNVENAFPTAIETHEKLGSRDFREAHAHVFKEFHRVRRLLLAKGAFAKPRTPSKTRSRKHCPDTPDLF